MFEKHLLLCLPAITEGLLTAIAFALQGMLLLFCALGPEEISEVRLGPLSPYAVQTLRLIKDFFHVQFAVRPEPASETIFLSCVGAGLKNKSKRVQ